VRDTRTRHELPRVSEGWTFVYAERCVVNRDRNAVLLEYGETEIAVPSAPLLAVLMGPGTTLTHAAMTLLGETGCAVVWCGENAVRCYAHGAAADRGTRNLERQAQMWADPERRREVVYRMYRMRFDEHLPEAWTIEQVRGREGVRVREAYAAASRRFGVEWRGRNYDRANWADADPVNRALSVANSCLYGLCHAAIVATGFSPALGFVHTGYELSFVHDVADLYKVKIGVPIAFETIAAGVDGLDSRVRRACRQSFFDNRILERVVPDIQRALGMRVEEVEMRFPQEELFGGLWDGAAGAVALGRNWGDEPEP
jgi:CRISPR-associated protein Cas1